MALNVLRNNAHLPIFQLFAHNREGELRKARPPQTTGVKMLSMMTMMGKLNLSAGLPKPPASSAQK